MSNTYRAADFSAFDLGEGRFALYTYAEGKTHAVDETTLAILQLCNRYAPLEVHAQAIALRQAGSATEQVDKGPQWWKRAVGRAKEAMAADPAQVGQIVDALQNLAEHGLLQSDKEFLAGGPSEDAEPGGATINTFGLTTRRRLEALKRSVGSYLENAETYGRELEVVIIDDSRTESDESATLQMLQQWPSSSIRFAGLKEREAFAQALAVEAGVSSELADFALFGDARCPLTTGTSRNNLLFDCAGEAFLLADDDGMYRVAPSPGRKEGLALGGGSDPTEFWFYRTRDDTLRESQFGDYDLFGLHEQYLGWNVGQQVSATQEAGKPIELTALGYDLERRIRRGCRVRMSMAGMVGDSGIGGSAYLFLNKPSQERLLQSEEFYRSVVESRQLLRAPVRDSIARTQFMMAGNVALDNRTLGPMFSPVQRNSDGFYARLQFRAFQNDCTAYLSHAVLHDPLQTRRQEWDYWWKRAGRFRFGEVGHSLLADVGDAMPHESPDSYYGRFGGHMKATCDAGYGALDERIRLAVFGQEGPKLARDRSQASKELPDYYVEARNRQLGNKRTYLTEPDYTVPADLLEHLGDKEAAKKLTLEVTRRFGELLEAWPELWRAAKRLREKDRRLSRPV